MPCITNNNNIINSSNNTNMNNSTFGFCENGSYVVTAEVIVYIYVCVIGVLQQLRSICNSHFVFTRQYRYSKYILHIMSSVKVDQN